ncbi:MAG: hypothetical protein JWQ08_1099 [Deinococcus sp.]|jgi:uncharacterized protein (DUF1684 family)|nr:hypothetical protein [Deinococcus sp.]
MNQAHTEAVAEFRRRKDEHFAAGRGPIQGTGLGEFRGLSYFAPNAAWVFTVPVQPGDLTEMTLATNTGEARTMARFGLATVDLPSGPHTLSLFAPLGEDRPARVFVPFRDATSRTGETYGAGRYLDAPLAQAPDSDETLVHLDFNMAYHPYCAYGDGWTCPLPPPENVLSDAVQVGEKLPGGAGN